MTALAVEAADVRGCLVYAPREGKRDKRGPAVGVLLAHTDDHVTLVLWRDNPPMDGHEALTLLDPVACVCGASGLVRDGRWEAC